MGKIDLKILPTPNFMLIFISVLILPSPCVFGLYVFVCVFVIASKLQALNCTLLNKRLP